MNESFNNKIQIDTIEFNSSVEILEFGGIGFNENLSLNSVFDSLTVFDLTTEDITYSTNFSNVDEWEIVEVNPEITINYTLIIKK